ncbi:MAG TPA: hypothetical protein VNC18_12605 [Gemmatimonadaceae bacterium]|jgi:hypothetical protein|nr:hypothetical protein [Gemmatimonadaceae bacterium]
MTVSSRRVVAGLIRFGLVLLAIVFVSGYFLHKRPTRSKHTMRIETEVPPPSALAPGDVRIYNRDSSVDLILAGNSILAGLSPKTIAKVKDAVNAKTSGETTGLGGSIAQIVKSSVASAIGTHASYPLNEIRDIRYEDNTIVFEWKNGDEHQLFNNTKVDGERVSRTFAQEDAERFIAAVKDRMAHPVPNVPPPPAAPKPPE